MSAQPHVLGVDVGGTKVAVAVVGRDGTPHAELERPTDVSSADALLAGVEAAVGEVVAAEGNPRAIGLGMPSQVDFASGTVVASVNIPLEGISVRDEVSRRLGGVPVFVDNDANCAALAEAHLAGDSPSLELVMLTLGTGVGGGVVVDGRIYRGSTGLGAELGHVVIDARAEGEVPEGKFPRPGSLEWLCSGTGLEREATRRGARGGEGELARIYSERGRVKGREAVDAARAGDPAALDVLAQHGRWLGMGIAGVVNTFEPEQVVIGGGLSRAADLFLETAKQEAARWALPASWARTRVELARGGHAAGVIGAGLLAWQELEAHGGDTGDRVANG